MDYFDFLKTELKKYKINTNNINKDTKILDIYIDSFDLLEIIITIENKFDIKIKNEKIYKIKTINDIILIIKKLLKNKKK